MSVLSMRGRRRVTLTHTIVLAALLVLQNASESTALKCKLVPVILNDDDVDVDIDEGFNNGDLDFGDEVIEYKCQVGDRMLEIDNSLDQLSNFLEGPHGGVAADFELDFNKASIVDHKFYIPSDSKMAYDRIKEGGSDGSGADLDSPTRRRRLGGKDPVGDQRVLVLYVEDGAGNKPSYVKDGEAGSVEDNIFGTYGDPIYPGERYSTCSQGHVDFVPWIGTTSTNVNITTGVYQVKITNIVDGASRGVIEDAVEVQAAADLGNLRSQFDYVMICLPYGSVNSSGSKGWGGYAYINHYLQVLNNNRCQRVSTMVHEFGHNLNLGHSGDYRTAGGAQAYADQIGFMGYSYSEDDGPLMCFNGPKTFQLNWYPNHYTTLTTPDYNWSGYLFHSSDAIGSTDMMVIKIPGFTSTRSEEYLDYYVSFNKYSGANSGTKEARNKVAIHTSQSEDYVWAPKSKLVAELNANEEFIFTALNVEVVVRVTSIDSTTAIPNAFVTIASGTESPSMSLVPSASTVPTQTPSISPSNMPSPVNGITLAPSSEFYILSTNFLIGEFWAAAESGIMFDVSVTEDTMITRLDIDLLYVGYDGLTFPTDIEIYTKTGSYVGYQTNSAAWTKHMDRTTVLPPDADDVSTLGLTPLKSDILSPIVIPGGTTLSIFITNRDVNNFIEMAYSTTAVDYVSDDNVMSVETGLFQQYNEFTGEDNDGWWWVPVAFSGIIYYDKTASEPSDSPSQLASVSPSISALPSLQPSSTPSAEPSVSVMPSLLPSSHPSLTPSTHPSLAPSAEPSISVMPSLMPSSHPSEEPSISVMPSLDPSSHPSEVPSISVMPSLQPSSLPSKSPSIEPSSRPSRAPTSLPSTSPSQLPTGEPSPSPTRRPTRTPTKEPTSDTPKPTTSTKPSYHPTNSPTTNPTTTVAPSAGPVITSSPSEPLFQTIVTTCSCTSPFRGISPSDLANRFAAIVSLLQAVMQKLLGPNRANWGTRVVRVGGIVARRLSIFEVAEIIAAADQDDVVEVEYEFTNTRECYSDDGCNADEQATAVQEGFEVLATVETVVTTGQLQQTIIDDSDSAGLSEELSSVEVGEVTVSTPEIEVVDATAYPSIYKTPAPVVPTSSPTYDCEDSPLRFKVMKDGKLISRYCSWVRVKRNSRCKLPGIREQCPQSCWRCRNCADSTLRFKILNKGIEQMRSCEWVGRRDTVARCTMIEGVSLTCPLTCGTCTRKTASPSINGSGSPSSAPSTPPTPAVSVVPTSSTPVPSPTPACYDSPLRFRVEKGETFMNRYCSWVATIPKRCINDGVPSICPQSCGACDTCADSSLAFKLSEDDNDFVSCDWVGEDTANRCSIEGVDRTCRATCGIGSCCSDSTEQFQFTYNGNVINKFCEWAARKDTKNRCAVAEVSANCPETCGSCDA
mmetsp:Transcript_26278/g.39385  ORF Transcript_26278/g.39385 Transcript_26278/m.39385 type:complete len:1408 (+) Transcript_26278:130-4353(+)